ncbi:GNAT family N-acetyltransferase [Macrococcus caseolyticus]|uniref:GNAT family N-acetyltransferase n=1 Tax=Macrococcoides caseolyticum TaxID=69966 RepID=UPI0024BBFCCB|nr:GNAT family N-acetyltransferase [Macrococcus caseolyticus]MDJ1090991.1 GNAT family N-acetyltransferase [Macrococcus caseolyticus]
MIIRSVEVKDAEKILEYTKIVGNESNNLLFGSEGIGLNVDQEVKVLESIINHPKQIMIVAIANDEIVGLANLSGQTRERIAHQARLAISVRKDYWGKDISSQLMSSLINFAKEIQIEVITLEVFSNNIRGIKLYEKFGFEHIGEFKKFAKINGEFVDAKLMNLYLK